MKTKHKRGLRGTVYEFAGKCGAFHSNVERTSIVYDADEYLTIRVLFSQKDKCGSFQSTLEAMVRRFFDVDADINHKTLYEERVMSPDLVAVLASHYISSDNPDSDQYSLYSHRSTPDAVDVDTEMQPMLWENAALSCFSGGCKGERCHLMSQTSYTQHASNENNLLIMSAENHFRFDGYSPKIAIRWVRETDRKVTVHGEELTYCDICIVCINDEVFACVGSNVKLGAARDMSNNTYTTSVAVPNPFLFKQYLTFKYLETVKLQASDESENCIAKISRVRAEVTQQMKREFGNLTIDLELKPKNKRNIAALNDTV